MPRTEDRICPAGHRYRKSSDCPACPMCEAGRKPEPDLLAVLSAPARRALEGAGIKTLAQLARRTEGEMLALHGFGPSSLPKLRAALAERGLAFRR